MLKGDLSSFSLGEIFQSLAINNHTGTLGITSPDTTEKLIYFDQGEIRRFSHGTSTELRIGEVLVRHGKITIDDLEDAYEAEKETRTSFGIALLQKGLVTKEDVVEALKTKIQEEVYDLFLYKSGHFEFHMNSCPDEAFDDLQKSAGVTLNTNSVIMEGLRRLDEWNVIHTKIASYNEIFKRTDTVLQGFTELDTEFLETIDGTRPVRELFDAYCGSRFELCSLLVTALDEGCIRFLTAEECVDSSKEHLRRKQHGKAADFLRFATELASDKPELFAVLGDVLTASYQDTEATQAYMCSVRLHVKQGNLFKAGEVGEKLLTNVHNLKEADLQTLFDAYLQGGNAKKALALGNQLAATLQKTREFDRAAEILETLVELNPDDVNLLIEIGTLFQKGNDEGRAARYFETAADALEKQKKYRELLKILRLLQGFHPKSIELKQRISATQALIEKQEQRKKRRVTIVGILAIVMGVLVVVPLMYELKAREFFNYAQRIEEISKIKGDFTKAKEAYLDLLKNFSFSTKVAQAEAALERISAQEKDNLAAMLPRSLDPTPTRDEKERRREAFKTALTEARAAEIAGDFKRAHVLYHDILETYKGLPETTNIYFPVRITTQPAGTNIVIRITKESFENQVIEKKGRTPFVHHYTPGETLSMELFLNGCETIKQEITLVGQHELHYELKRKPTQTFTPAVATYQDFVSSHGRFIFPSRDGHLYAIDANRGTVLWKRSVGHFGDRVSDISSSKAEVYLGTVTGEVTSISVLNGKSRWVTRVDQAVYAAPAVSADGAWAAVGTLSGTVYLIDNRDGKIVGQFSTENELLTQPLFAGDLLIVGSMDNSVHFYSLATRRVVVQVEMGADIISRPALAGEMLVVSTARAIHGVNLADATITWTLALKQRPTTPVFLSATGAHVGTASGWLITFDPQNGALRHERSLGSSPLISGMNEKNRLYACLASGEIFALHLDSNETIWRYDTELPILASPVAREGRLYINNTSGRFLVFEIIE